MILVANMICNCRFVADGCPGLFCSSKDSFTVLFHSCCQRSSCFSNVDTSVPLLCVCIVLESATAPSPPLDNIRVTVIVWRSRGNIIRTAVCWIVWHKMFTVRSTLIWAVLTGQTDWVCHIGTLTLCIEVVA